MSILSQELRRDCDTCNLCAGCRWLMDKAADEIERVSALADDAIVFCQAYVRFLDGSQNALCGMEKIARSVARRTKGGTP